MAHPHSSGREKIKRGSYILSYTYRHKNNSLVKIICKIFCGVQFNFLLQYWIHTLKYMHIQFKGYMIIIKYLNDCKPMCSKSLAIFLIQWAE